MMKKVLAAILTLVVLLTPVLSLAETVTIGVTGAFYGSPPLRPLRRKVSRWN